MFFIPRISTDLKNKQAIFGWSIDRPDYAKLSEAYKKDLGWEFCDVCLGGKVCGWKFRLDFSALYFATKQALKTKDINVFDKLIVLMGVYTSVSFYRFLEQKYKDVRPEYYLSFNSSFSYESVFTSFLRERDVKTFSMQHGMYFEFKNNPPFEMVTSYFCTAEYFLLWGQYSKNQIKKYVPCKTKLIVFGNPLYRLKVTEHFNSYNPASKDILVCLPRYVYQKENIELLNMLSNSCFAEYQFIIRPHPNLDKKIIDDIVLKNDNFSLSVSDTLKNDMAENNFKIMVGFNSTVLFESFIYGVPVAQYLSGNDEFEMDSVSKFTNATELLECMNAAKIEKLERDFYFSDSVSQDFYSIVNNLSI